MLTRTYHRHHHHCHHLVKVLLDPERLDGGADKDKFLGVFYDFYIHWLVTPFVEPNEPDRFDPTPEFSRLGLGTTAAAAATAIDGGGGGGGGGAARRPRLAGQSASAIAASRRILLDIFSLCVHGHSYRMKYFVMRNNVISRALRVLRSPHRHLHVSAIKVNDCRPRPLLSPPGPLPHLSRPALLHITSHHGAVPARHPGHEGRVLQPPHRQARPAPGSPKPPLIWPLSSPYLI